MTIWVLFLWTLKAKWKVSTVRQWNYCNFKLSVTPGNITNWFEGNKITETLKSTLSKTLELPEEKQLAKKAENLIDDLKKKCFRLNIAFKISLHRFHKSFHLRGT